MIIKNNSRVLSPYLELLLKKKEAVKNSDGDIQAHMINAQTS